MIKSGSITIKYTVEGETPVDLIHGVRGISEAITVVMDRIKSIPEHHEDYIVAPTVKLTYWSFE